MDSIRTGSREVWRFGEHSGLPMTEERCIVRLVIRKQYKSLIADVAPEYSVHSLVPSRGGYWMVVFTLMRRQGEGPG